MRLEMKPYHLLGPLFIIMTLTAPAERFIEVMSILCYLVKLK